MAESAGGEGAGKAPQGGAQGTKGGGGFNLKSPTIDTPRQIRAMTRRACFGLMPAGLPTVFLTQALTP